MDWETSWLLSLEIKICHRSGSLDTELEIGVLVKIIFERIRKEEKLIKVMVSSEV